MEKWPDIWRRGLRKCFAEAWVELAEKTGEGLLALMGSVEDMQQAMDTCSYGLLAGRGVTVEHLRAVGKRIPAEKIV